MRLIALAPALASLALAACVSNTPASAPVPPEPSVEQRIAAECVLLGRAATMMASAGQPPHVGLNEGCPGVTDVDARPIEDQMASLRLANSARLPVGLVAGTRGEEVYRRMLTRGVPISLAEHLITSPQFAEAAM